MTRLSVVRAVALTFVLFGVWALGQTAYDVALGRPLNLPTEVIELWLGVELLRLSPSARVWAVRYLVLQFCLAPVGVLLLFRAPSVLTIRVLSVPLSQVAVPVVLGVVAVSVALCIWQYRVLRDPRVQALFALRTASLPHSRLSV